LIINKQVFNSNLGS